MEVYTSLFSICLPILLNHPSRRLDLGSSDISYQRMRAAINSLNGNLAEQEDASEPGKEVILQGTGLRDVLLKGFMDKQSPDDTTTAPARFPGIFAENQMLQSWAKRYQALDPVVMEGDPKLELNSPQIRAVATMLANRMSLIQGVRSWHNLVIRIAWLTLCWGL